MSTRISIKEDYEGWIHSLSIFIQSTSANGANDIILGARYRNISLLTYQTCGVDAVKSVSCHIIFIRRIHKE